MEASNLTLITYVIEFKGGRYYTTRSGKIRDWSKPYSTDNLAEANIYDTVDEARNAMNKFTTKGGKIVPKSKKIFFEASLKGLR